MRYSSLPLVSLAVILLLSEEGLAHRVSVFAFVDGDEIQVECAFSRNQKVRNGKLTITDSESGALILEGVTDARGRFRFRPPDEFLATGHGLNIRLLAGEGHRDDWKIPPGELRALSRGRPSGTDPAAPANAPAPAAARTAEKAGNEPGARPPALDAAEFEAILGRVLDAKLSPINQSLARRERDGPELRDVVGGIGWILGLLGLAAYLKHRG